MLNQNTRMITENKIHNIKHTYKIFLTQKISSITVPKNSSSNILKKINGLPVLKLFKKKANRKKKL